MRALFHLLGFVQNGLISVGKSLQEDPASILNFEKWFKRRLCTMLQPQQGVQNISWFGEGSQVRDRLAERFQGTFTPRLLGHGLGKAMEAFSVMFQGGNQIVRRGDARGFQDIGCLAKLFTK